MAPMAFAHNAVISILIIVIPLTVLFVWFLVLVFRALLKYLRSNAEREVRDSSVPVSLPETLKSHRTRSGMTQEFVAESLGVSRQAVSKWENGTSSPSTANLLALAKLYGISAAELLQEMEL